MRFSMRVAATLVVLGFTSAALAEQIDNPEYAQWAKYKAGTFVTTQQTMDMANMAANPNMPAGMNMAAMMPQSTITTKITEVKPEAVTLEVTTDTTQMGRSNTAKSTRVVPAKIDPAVATATAPATNVQADVKDLKEGKDTVEVKGKKIDTLTREYTTTITAQSNGMGRGGAGAAAPTSAHVKVWTSTEIPGGMVKSETTTTAGQMGDVKVTLTLVDYNVVK